MLPMLPGEARAEDAPQRIVVDGKSNSAADQRRESTIAVTVVGREDLDAYGDSSILDVLQRVPGISIDGDTPKLRGMGGGYTQILLNGEPAPPGFTLDSLAPSEIERIEIIKGPTAEFGGVAGTINVILRSAPKLRQREWRASAGYRAVKPQGSTSSSWGDRIGSVGFHLPISVYSWANAANLEVTRVSRSEVGAIDRQQVVGRDEWVGSGVNVAPRIDWKVGEEDTLNWQAFVQRNENENNSRRDTYALEGPPPFSVQDRSVSGGTWQLARSQAQWVHKAAEGRRVEAKASAQGSLWSGQGSSQGRDPVAVPGVLRDTLSSNRENSATVAGRWLEPAGAAHTLSLGIDLEERRRRELARRFDDRVEQFTGSIGVPFTARTSRVTAFAQDDWQSHERWSLSAGLRAEQVRLVTGGPSGETANDFIVLSPVVHLRHALDAKGRDLVRFSAARSIRMPDIGLMLPRYSLNGQYDRETRNTPIAADSAGNPLLKPETSTGFDLAWEQHLGGGGVASVGVFDRRIERLIRRRITEETVAEANVPRWVSRPTNLGGARSSGLELELKGQGDELLGGVWAGAPKTLQLRAALSLYRSSVEQIDDPDARLEGQAPWSASVGFDHAGGGSELAFGCSFTTTPGFATQQTDRQRVWRGALQRLDAYLLWRFDRQSNLRVAVNNALHGESVSTTRIDDLAGFAAGADTRRQNLAQFTATLQLRF